MLRLSTNLMRILTWIARAGPKLTAAVVPERRGAHDKRGLSVIQQSQHDSKSEQRLKPAVSFLVGPFILVIACVVCGCATATTDAEIPRTLGGEMRLGRFVPPFAYEAYVRGELALARGDIEGAVAQFELATAAPDEDAYLLSRLAWAQALSGDSKGAERTLAHAAKVDGCSEPVWTTRARLAERTRDLARARAAFAEATHCAPYSAAGPIGLSRVLVALGERERAQAVLEAFALRVDRPESYEAALALALVREDSIAVGAALEGMLATGAPPATTLHAAIEQALALDRPLLAARLMDHARPAVPPTLAARVCLARGDVACAQGKLAMTATAALGGAAEATELLLAAELFERAEVEASVALVSSPSPRLFLLRARARAALGQTHAALEDLAQVHGSEHATAVRALLVSLTRKAGLSGLAQELAPQASAQ